MKASSLCGEWIAGRAVWQRRRRLERSGRAEEKELLLGAPWPLGNALPRRKSWSREALGTSALRDPSSRLLGTRVSAAAEGAEGRTPADAYWSLEEKRKKVDW